jgi:hypothetical protein
MRMAAAEKRQFDTGGGDSLLFDVNLAHRVDGGCNPAAGNELETD